MINKSQEIMLSVVIPTYNHEKYIKKAIDSVLAQKTEYSFEVLVGEDKSLDNTKLVLQDYERLNPGKIKVFYRDHNLSNDKLKMPRIYEEGLKENILLLLKEMIFGFLTIKFKNK